MDARFERNGKDQKVGMGPGHEYASVSSFSIRQSKGKDIDEPKYVDDFRISSLYALSTAVRDLETMLILGKPPIDRFQSTKKGMKEPYNRDQYWSYAADKKSAFLKLYLFCFALAKPELVLCHSLSAINYR